MRDFKFRASVGSVKHGYEVSNGVVSKLFFCGFAPMETGLNTNEVTNFIIRNPNNLNTQT